MKYTSEIFQRLSNGKFISANSIDPMAHAIFLDLEEHQQEYADYYAQIDFQLCAGDGYFYFSRKEQKMTVENKLQGLLSWIDNLDFLKAYDTSFDVGTQFNLAQMEVQLGANLELKDKLQNIFPDKVSNHDKLEALVASLVSMGFAEEVNEIEGFYQVTSAFHYIENIIDCINISEEVSDEIPE